MTRNATPEDAFSNRPIKYPEHLAAMLPTELKASIIEAVNDPGTPYETQGEVVRDWLTVGRRMREAKRSLVYVPPGN